MVATLDQQLQDLCDVHGLTHIALQLFTLPDGTRFFGATAHCGDLVGSSNGSGKTLPECFKEALLNLRAKQAPVDEFAPLSAAA